MSVRVSACSFALYREPFYILVLPIAIGLINDVTIKERFLKPFAFVKCFINPPASFRSANRCRIFTFFLLHSFYSFLFFIAPPLLAPLHLWRGVRQLADGEVATFFFAPHMLAQMYTIHLPSLTRVLIFFFLFHLFFFLLSP